jgi:Uma2 family endonuclease
MAKDTKLLRDLYAKAGVMEYWLIDARSATPSMEILQLTDGSYRSASRTDAGYRSLVLSRNISLIQEPDPLGNPRYQFRITR